MFALRAIVTFIIAAAGFSSTPAPVLAQNTFEPIPKQEEAKYHFDLSRNFFPTPSAEEASRATLVQRLKRFSELRGKVTASSKNLLSAMSEFASLQTKIGIHQAYLYLRYAMDTRNAASLDELNKLIAEANRSMGFLGSELMTLDDKTLARFISEAPALKAYAFAIEATRRYRPYTLEPQQQEILDSLAPTLVDWQSELFSRMMSTTDFGTVRTAKGDLSLKTNLLEIFNNPDRKVRETGFKQNFAALASRRDTYAFALTQGAAARNQLARLRKFADYPAEFYFDLYLTRDDVSALLERMAQLAEVNKRLERLRIGHIKKVAGYTEVHTWDLNVTPPGTQVPRFTIGEATRVMRAAVAPLGEEYVREFDALFDPANGRLDIAPGEFRLNRPGFSNGGPGRPSVFYSGGFKGFLEDMTILVHEGGHAVQNMLMNNRGVLPAYTFGPSYFTESFAGFNELLLLDYLYRTAPDKTQKIYFLERFVDQAAGIFKTARESLVELELYDGVERGVIRNADDIESLMQKTGARFSVWFGPESERPMEWVNVITYYTWPLYRINYLYATLLALKYFDLYTRDRNRFVPAYLELLRNGYDAPPEVLLKKIVGTSTHDPRLVEDALDVINKKVTELEQLYKE